MTNEKTPGSGNELSMDEITNLISGVNQGNAADLMKKMRQEAEQSISVNSSFQDEIDRMLNEIDVAPKNENSHNAAKLPAQSVEQDFYSDSYPHKCTKDQISVINKIFENFTSCAVKSLSAFYGKQVSVFLASIDQLTMGDFIRTLPNPTSIGIVNMEPLKGSAIIEITYPMDISSLSPAIFESLRIAWSNIINLQLKLEKAISNPEEINITPGTEGVVVLTFEAEFGTIEAMMNISIPYSVIKPIFGKR